MDVDAEMEALERKLDAEFSGAVDHAEIARTIRETRREFGDPPITQFLPILIEREVRSSLRV